jgi:hypothetical protein
MSAKKKMGRRESKIIAVYEYQVLIGFYSVVCTERTDEPLKWYLRESVRLEACFLNVANAIKDRPSKFFDRIKPVHSLILVSACPSAAP